MTQFIELDPVLRIGTRGSAIALRQASGVAQALVRKGLSCGYTIVPVGQQSAGGDPSAFAGGSLQTAALRSALAQGRCDVAVHFAKDLPVDIEPAIGAVMARHDPREALVSAGCLSLAELPYGARVGVPEGVRRLQLLGLREDLTIVTVRGSVSDRLALIDDGRLDAIVLSHAVVVASGVEDRIGELFSLAAMIPTAAQGITVVEVGAGVDPSVMDLLRAVTDPDTALRWSVERAVQVGLSRQTTDAVGVVSDLATVDQTRRLRVRVVVCGSSEMIRDEQSIQLSGDADQDHRASSQLAERLVSEVGPRSPAPAPTVPSRGPGLRVMYDASAVGAGEYFDQIQARGATAVPVELTQTQYADQEQLDTVFEQMARADCVGIASPLVVEVLAEHAELRGVTLDSVLEPVRVGAIGSATAAALARQYVSFEVVPATAVSITTLEPVWPRFDGDGPRPVTVIPSSSNSSPALSRMLGDLGWQVEAPVVYTRVPAECGPQQQQAMADGWPDVIILSTRSSVQALEALYGLPPDGVKVVVVGKYAVQDAIDLGMRVDLAPMTSRAPDVVRLSLADRAADSDTGTVAV
ncbi:MAG: uroporphyrinogen-III synthase [Propionibacteriaceae bacterium]|nr:uroporphyrinogen-III synthase [Propionibacteriaceae bacterium]